MSRLAEDVARGLGSRPKSLPPIHFYDALGSQLFDAICRLPWYRITRAELALLPRAAPRVFDGRVRTLVELGPGSGEKLAALLAAAEGRVRTAVHLVDISAAALEEARRRLETLRDVTVHAHRGTFEEGLASSSRDGARGDGRLVLFLGSNIGNLDPPASARFLCSIRRTLEKGAGLLLGADLVKSEAELVLAYDDPLGVTAAFDKNLLVRMNRELGAAFPLDAFRHRAVWNAEESRVEMHLVAERALEIAIPGAGITAHFEEGESLFTESSYKYEREDLEARARAEGFETEEVWEDLDARYALFLFRAV
jgi:L-histidine N-alpha-methyltransferase